MTGICSFNSRVEVPYAPVEKVCASKKTAGLRLVMTLDGWTRSSSVTFKPSAAVQSMVVALETWEAWRLETHLELLRLLL